MSKLSPLLLKVQVDLSTKQEKPDVIQCQISCNTNRMSLIDVILIMKLMRISINGMPAEITLSLNENGRALINV